MDNEKMLELIDNKQFKEVKEMLTTYLIPDIANILEEIDDNIVRIKIFRLLPKDKSAEVFSYISSDMQENIINSLTDKEIELILDDMFLDDAVDFIEEMPAGVVERILNNTSTEDRGKINQFLSYKEDTAGTIMTNEFLDMKRGAKISSTINKIKKIGRDLETINAIYITDKSRVIEGYITIKDLILADENDKVEDVMHTNIIFAYTHTDQEEIARIFTKYSISVLPIVDNEKRLVGIVTVDDVMDVIQEENTEDLQKMSAILPDDKPYLKRSVISIYLHRLPWLLILMISATITGYVISQNEELLSSGIWGIVLTSAIPMLMDTGGNSGSQASVTIIRGLALNQIEFKDIFRVMWKEFRVSILLGVSLSVVCFIKLLLLNGLAFTSGGVMVAFVISFSMLVTILIAKIIGCTFPLIAKQLHLDPAVMAAPLITTIVDALSLIIYCNIATSFLNM